METTKDNLAPHLAEYALLVSLAPHVQPLALYVPLENFYLMMLSQKVNTTLALTVSHVRWVFGPVKQVVRSASHVSLENI